MYYSVDIYPNLSKELSEGVAAIRRRYDPTWRLTQPHVNICFPGTRNLDQRLLVEHVDHVLGSWSPFVITLGGFHKSRDHWLFITLLEGAEAVVRLYHELYTDYIAPYKKPAYTPTPHVGLGLFIKSGYAWDYRAPREEDFDRARYEDCLRMAEALPLPESVLVDRIHLTAIPEVLTEFTTGKRLDLPDDTVMEPVHEFRLNR